MAQAYLNFKGNGRFHAESAGSHPAARVNPLAIETLERHRIPWNGHPPQSMDGLERGSWDIVITVCDRAKESCPFFPGQPIIAHWGMEDPAEVTGPDDVRRRAFDQAFVTLARRIELLLALPIAKLERLAMEGRIRAIGNTPPGVM